MAKSTATIFLTLKKCLIITFILSSSACSNDLSRNKASDIINHFESAKTLGWANCNVDLNKCFITTDLFHPTKKEKEGLFLLEKEGFIKINDEKNNDFSLNDKAMVYTIPNKFRSNFIEIVTKTVNHVEVTGISKPSDMFGQKICTATYIVHYQITPFGEILVSKDEINLSKQGNATFVLYDDGWRIAR